MGAFQPLSSIVQSYRGMIINYYSQYDYYFSTGFLLFARLQIKLLLPHSP
jgi:hypothetical protein